jgi:phosphoribosyl 1,2-cyclic phosphodiesterase
MKVKFWGVRGSIPTPLSEKVIVDKVKKSLKLATPADIVSDKTIDRFVESLPMSIKSTYGGNSTCLQIIPDNQDVIIVDCGSGLKNLGSELMNTNFGKGQGEANIFMTHSHWDHIQGIPFFVPFFVAGNKFTFYSPIDNMRQRIEYQQDAKYFPVNLDYMSATKEFITLDKEGELFLNGIKIANKRMHHPGGSFGYRFEENGKILVFTSDCEFNIDEIEKLETYKSFFMNADVLIFDTQYTFEESFSKIDWGHSTASIAIDIAVSCNVKKLILFHHDPDYSDDKLDMVLASAKSYVAMNAQNKNIDLEVELAIEGREIEV